MLNELSEYINNDSGIETICRFLRTKYIPTYDEIILQYGEDIVINNFTNKFRYGFSDVISKTFTGQYIFQDNDDFVNNIDLKFIIDLNENEIRIISSISKNFYDKFLNEYYDENIKDLFNDQINNLIQSGQIQTEVENGEIVDWNTGDAVVIIKLDFIDFINSPILK